MARGEREGRRWYEERGEEECKCLRRWCRHVPPTPDPSAYVCMCMRHVACAVAYVLYVLCMYAGVADMIRYRERDIDYKMDNKKTEE